MFPILIKPDWIVSFGKQLCELTVNQQKILANTDKLLDAILIDSRLNDTDINFVISELPFDINKCFSEIIKQHPK